MGIRRRYNITQTQSQKFWNVGIWAAATMQLGVWTGLNVMFNIFGVTEISRS
jgi:hypothetical protein